MSADEGGQPAEVLRAVLARQMGRAPARAADAATRGAFLLLDRAPLGADAEGLITVTLEGLLRQIAGRTERPQVESQGRLRGRPDWPATLRARQGKGGDPSRLVSRAPRRAHDTLENQLLKLLVARLARCLREVPRELRRGYCLIGPAGELVPSAPRLLRMEQSLARLGGHRALREVSQPARLGPEHLRAACASRVKGYGLAASLALRLVALVDRGDHRLLAEVAGRALPLPAAPSPAAEPYLRLAAALLRG